MQLSDVLCYIFLVITVTATCAEGNDKNTETEVTNHEKRISKRDATVLVNGFPVQFANDRAYQPKVIYRRISKQRYGPPIKSRPPRTKYGPTKIIRKPVKKYQSSKPKYLSKSRPSYLHSRQTHKKRVASKPRYGPPSGRPRPQSNYGPASKKPHHNNYFAPDGAGFGEPPTDHYNDYHSSQQTYGEPPVDSYGTPLIRDSDDPHQTAQSSQETRFYFGNHESDFRHEYQSVKHPPNHNYDTNPAPTKVRSKFQKPDTSIYVTTTPPEEFDDDDELDPDAFRNQLLKDKKIFRQKKPYLPPKNVRKPWRPNKNHPVSDEIIVGGQYAEPPARYVPKFQPSAPMYDDDDEAFSPKRVGFVDPLIATSAYKSPYINYKNSNLAFSPQNLNDAFSIVDK